MIKRYMHSRRQFLIFFLLINRVMQFLVNYNLLKWLIYSSPTAWAPGNRNLRHQILPHAKNSPRTIRTFFQCAKHRNPIPSSYLTAGVHSYRGRKRIWTSLLLSFHVNDPQYHFCFLPTVHSLLASQQPTILRQHVLCIYIILYFKIKTLG